MTVPQIPPFPQLSRGYSRLRTAIERGARREAVQAPHVAPPQPAGIAAGPMSHQPMAPAPMPSPRRAVTPGAVAPAAPMAPAGLGAASGGMPQRVTPQGPAPAMPAMGPAAAPGATRPGLVRSLGATLGTNMKAPVPTIFTPKPAPVVTAASGLADRVFAQDPNGPDKIGDRFRAYSSPADGKFKPLDNAGAAQLHAATGYMPNVTVCGAFGQGPAQLTLKEKLKYGNAKEQADAGRVVTDRLIANKDGRHFGGAIPKTDPTTGRVYFASAPGAAAAAPEMDPAKIRSFAAERGLDLTPSGRGLMGPSSPGNRPDAATLDANRAKYQAARAQTLKERLAGVQDGAAQRRSDREARARGPLQQAIFKRDQQVAAAQQLEKDKLAGAERMQGGELANRLAVANIQATAQREVAAADRDLKLAIAKGDREAAAAAQDRLLAAQDKQNQAANALNVKEIEVQQEANRLAAATQNNGVLPVIDSAPPVAKQNGGATLAGLRQDQREALAAIPPEQMEQYIRATLGITDPDAIARLMKDVTGNPNISPDNPNANRGPSFAQRIAKAGEPGGMLRWWGGAWGDSLYNQWKASNPDPTAISERDRNFLGLKKIVMPAKPPLTPADLADAPGDDENTRRIKANLRRKRGI